MSFDPFQARLDFLQLIRKLNASQPSIQKVVAFATRYASRCGEDLWECIVEESGKGSLNTRINILYFLDSLIDVSASSSSLPYPALLARDLGTIVAHVVPESREGVLNARSARQILDSWRTRRLVEPALVDGALEVLEERQRASAGVGHGDADGGGSSRRRGEEGESFSRGDILRRMEEDRERHKRLRERIWILPIPPLHPAKKSRANTLLASASASASGAGAGAGAGAGGAAQSSAGQSPSSGSPMTPASPSVRDFKEREKAAAAGGAGSMAPPPVPSGREVEVPSALEVEFEQAWEMAGELGEEDLGRMRE